METKRCTKCGEEKPITEFHKNVRSKDGLHCYCKECNCIQSQLWRVANIDRAREYAREHSREQRKSNSGKIRDRKKVDLDAIPGSIYDIPNRKCYLAKARKLMRGEVVDPHCDKEEGEE